MIFEQRAVKAKEVARLAVEQIEERGEVMGQTAKVGRGVNHA